MIDNKAIDKMSFEEALNELETIVKKIDSGEEDLAGAVESFERGVQLKKHCGKMLSDAKLKVEKIIAADEEGVKTTALEVD